MKSVTDIKFLRASLRWLISIGLALLLSFSANIMTANSDKSDAQSPSDSKITRVDKKVFN